MGEKKESSYELFKRLGALVDMEEFWRRLDDDSLYDDDDDDVDDVDDLYGDGLGEDYGEKGIDEIFEDEEEIIKEIQEEAKVGSGKKKPTKEELDEAIKAYEEKSREQEEEVQEKMDKIIQENQERFKRGFSEDDKEGASGVGGIYRAGEGDMGFVEDEDFSVLKGSDSEGEEKGFLEDEGKGSLEDMENSEDEKEKDVLYDSEGRPVNFQVAGEVYTESISLEDILIPPRTRRALDDEGIENLEKLIMQWGLIDPLHVIPFNGKYLLVHGFRRYQALKNLGYKKAICLVDTTRPKATVRFLEVICNNTKGYNFFEMMDFGEFIERKQKTFQNSTIESIVGMEPGDYLKAKYIRQFDQFGIIGDILSGKKTIKEGFKKLERELEKLEKEQQELALEKFDEQGLTESYLEFIEEEAELQSTDDRHPLPRHISDRIKARDGYTCQSCGLGFHQPELISVFELHHIVPVFRGGRDEDSNLMLVCSNCHKVIHAYAEGKFSPPQDRLKYYKNMILLGNIVKKGLPDDRTAYKFYMDECEQSWLVV